MRIFCINMVEAVERRRHIQSQAKLCNLDIEIIEAVNGSAMTEEERREAVFKPAQNPLTPGEIGCALSHRKVYEKILEENLDIAMILEDDVIFDRDIHRFMNAAAMADPCDPEIFLVTDVKTYIKSRKRVLSGLAFHPALNGNGAYTYIITRQAAANLLGYLHPVRTVVDDWKLFMLLGLVRIWVCDERFMRHNHAVPSHLCEARSAVFRSPERKAYMRSLRGDIPWKNKLAYYGWKYFVRPFERIEERE